MKRIFVLLIIMSLSGCEESGAIYQIAPVHIEVVVPKDVSGTWVAEVEAQYSLWVRETDLDKPGSTFSVIQYDQQEGTTDVLTCIVQPDDWGRRRTKNPRTRAFSRRRS